MQARVASGDGDFYGSAFPEASSDAVGSAFVVVFVLVLVGLLLFGLVSAARRAGAERRGAFGGAPVARPQRGVGLQARAAQLGLLQGRALEQRLAELDDLAERGVITAQERLEARARLLAPPVL